MASSSSSASSNSSSTAHEILFWKASEHVAHVWTLAQDTYKRLRRNSEKNKHPPSRPGCCLPSSSLSKSDTIGSAAAFLADNMPVKRITNTLHFHWTWLPFGLASLALPCCKHTKHFSGHTFAMGNELLPETKLLVASAVHFTFVTLEYQLFAITFAYVRNTVIICFCLHSWIWINIYILSFLVCDVAFFPENKCTCILNINIHNR